MWLLLYQSVRILCILRLVMLYQASLSGQSEKSRNLDTVAQLRLEFLATRAVTISERYKKHLMHLTVFSQFQGKQQRRMSMEMNPKIIHICDFTWNWKGKGECRPVQNWLSDTILYLRYIFQIKCFVELHLFGTKIQSYILKIYWNSFGDFQILWLRCLYSRVLLNGRGRLRMSGFSNAHVHDVQISQNLALSLRLWNASNVPKDLSSLIPLYSTQIWKEG